MICAISLNPSMDRTLRIDRLIPGKTHRVRSTRVDAGGKGINACLHLKALGAERVACVGLMRQESEGMFLKRLAQADIECDWLTLAGHVRFNVKILEKDGQLTECNEMGEKITGQQAKFLLHKCAKRVIESRIVILTGSLPPGMPDDTYAQLIQVANEAHVPTVLDADGAALSAGIRARPTIVKPNRAELERWAGRPLPTLEDLLCAAHRMRDCGAQTVCASLGADGALCVTQEEDYFAPAIPVSVKSTVGAGDAMTAALALAIARGEDGQTAFCDAMAASAAAVCTEGAQALLREEYMRCRRLVHALPLS